MPVAIALIFCVVMLAVCLIGIIWALALLLPFYAYIGVAAYLIWRSKQKEAELAESVARETERQRLLNEQEMRVWRASLENEQRSASRRERVLRRFDRTRDPPQK
jgi:ABC-type transport system involved in cytochrome bd biosynthesis fused ATPase/permease subunit